MLFCSGAVSSGSNTKGHQHREDDVETFQSPSGPKYNPGHAAAAAGRTSQDSMGTTMSGSFRASLDTVARRSTQGEEIVADDDVNEVSTSHWAT